MVYVLNRDGQPLMPTNRHGMQKHPSSQKHCERTHKNKLSK